MTNPPDFLPGVRVAQRWSADPPLSGLVGSRYSRVLVTGFLLFIWMTSLTVCLRHK